MKNLFNKFSALVFLCVMSLFLAASGVPAWAIGVGLLALSQIPLPAGIAMMAITYPTGCDEVDLVHNCAECDDPELARIRGIAFIKTSFSFSDPTSYTEWFNGIASGDIIIIPFTRGSFDGGTVKEGPGYGDQLTKYIGSDYSLTYFDPNYAVNRDFYNNLKRSQGYKLAYKTETLVHITDKACQVLPKAPVADDPTAEVVWEINVKWTSQEEPDPFTAPENIFICFDVE